MLDAAHDLERLQGKKNRSQAPQNNPKRPFPQAAGWGHFTNHLPDCSDNPGFVCPDPEAVVGEELLAEDSGYLEDLAEEL